jgi:hypothetical protein
MNDQDHDLSETECAELDGGNGNPMWPADPDMTRTFTALPPGCIYRPAETM